MDTTTSTGSGKTPEQQRRDAVSAELQKGIPEGAIKEKSGFSYVSSHYVIATLNRIFGFDGWQSEVITAPHIVKEFIREVPEKDDQGKPSGSGNMVENHVAIVASTTRLHACGTYHDGVGMGVAEAPIDSFAGNLDKSFKESATDGLKRAAIYFGDPFGLTLYDKDAEPNIIRVLPPTPAELAERLAHYEKALAAVTDAAGYEKLRAERDGEHADVIAAVKDKQAKEWKAVAQRVGWQPPAPTRPATSSLSFKFGQKKGEPISNLDDKDLDWYEGACQRDLADPEKKKYEKPTKKNLAAIAAEKAYRVAEKQYQTHQQKQQSSSKAA